MTDRELLEAAAKAAGLDLDFCMETDRPAVRDQHGGAEFWNPLTSDGDALRLAAKLRMSVEPWGAGAAAVVSIESRARVAEPHYGDDPERATRRAIVRAAAELSKGLRPFPTAEEIREDWT